MKISESLVAADELRKVGVMVKGLRSLLESGWQEMVVTVVRGLVLGVLLGMHATRLFHVSPQRTGMK